MPKSSDRKRTSRTSSRGTSRRTESAAPVGVMEMAREHPFTAAAAAVAVGALAAGIFLWSRRDQISDQFGHLIEGLSGEEEEFGEDISGGTTTPAVTRTTGTSRSRTRTPTRGLSETGGGNASLGARRGGGGTRTSASGRGRARPVRTI